MLNHIVQEIIRNTDAVVVANGSFPQHSAALAILSHAQCIVCCDGAADKLIAHGIEPSYIIGDLDSVSDAIKQKHADKLIHIPEQDTNDQTKAVEWLIQNGYTYATILGATGQREDHTIGNISLLAEYSTKIEVRLITDYGIFTPVQNHAVFSSYSGQAVSIFSIYPHVAMRTHGLAYPIDNKILCAWWQGTLNKATDSTFEIDIHGGQCIVFQAF